MAYAYQASVAAQNSSGGSGTSGSIDTTSGGNATLIVACVSYLTGSAPTFADSAGNSWTLTAVSTSDASLGNTTALIYCENPNTSATHTFSMTGTGCYAAIAVASFRGSTGSALIDTGKTDSVDQAGGTVTSLQVGSTGFTPSAANDLCIVGWGAAIPDTVGSMNSNQGTLVQGLAFNTGVTYGVGIGYLIEGAATLFQPTLSWVHPQNNVTGVSAGFLLTGTGSGGGGAAGPVAEQYYSMLTQKGH